MTRNKTFDDLKKHTYDNMSIYLAKKEERIKERQKASEKRSSQQAATEEATSERTRVNTDNEDQSLTAQDSLIDTQPPEKKLKIDCPT